MKKIQKACTVIVIAIILITTVSTFTIDTYATTPTKPTPTSPANGQILPYYDVRLRWNDVSNETYYTVTVRDISISETSTESLVYHETQVAQNICVFVIPKSKLIRGHKYRWVVLSNNSDGKTCSTSMHFEIEKRYTGSNVCANDSHVTSFGFSSAQRLEYFIYAETSGYADILNTAAQSWNGISSKVNLIRTGAPTDGKYEMGIYESPTPNSPTSFGYACLRSGGINGVEVAFTANWDFAELRTFRENIINYYSSTANTSNFLISSAPEYLLSNAMHEIGHSLSLKHTGNTTDVAIPIYRSFYNSSNIGLIMNSFELLGKELTLADTNHLRIKWGA